MFYPEDKVVIKPMSGLSSEYLGAYATVIESDSNLSRKYATIKIDDTEKTIIIEQDKLISKHDYKALSVVLPSEYDRAVVSLKSDFNKPYLGRHGKVGEHSGGDMVTFTADDSTGLDCNPFLINRQDLIHEKLYVSPLAEISSTIIQTKGLQHLGSSQQQNERRQREGGMGGI